MNLEENSETPDEDERASAPSVLPLTTHATSEIISKKLLDGEGRTKEGGGRRGGFSLTRVATHRS